MRTLSNHRVSAADPADSDPGLVTNTLQTTLSTAGRFCASERTSESRHNTLRFSRLGKRSGSLTHGGAEPRG
jgi:hypothetical protein